jgi:hypothetical protein
MIMRTRNLLFGLAAVTASAVLVGPQLAGAASGTGGGSTTDLRPRLELACRRIPNLETRVDRLLTRLQGDASVTGSLAWLQARIDKAQSEGRTDLVTVLTNRLTVRTAAVSTLQARQVQLADLAARCAAHGVGG